MTLPQVPKSLSVAAPIQDAHDQAEAYDSIFADTPLELDDGTVLKIPPHPDFGMLDDEATEAYEELLFTIDTKCDREEDIFIPEQRLKDDKGNETGVVLPASTHRGALKRPYRIGNELMKPPYSVRVVQAALGESDYKQLRAGGRNAADVWKIWGRQGLEAQKRQAADSKSDGGAVAVEAVSQTDSQ